ncbi:MAG: hypothetical protein IJP43_07710 [Oscillospiraceae bacterium]|nr:hypothetical protein [Oscillospiraceae bacterium]
MLSKETRAEFEYGVIGGLINYPHRISQVAVKLSADVFSNELCSNAFKTLCAMDFEKAPIDVLTVKARLNCTREWMKGVIDLMPGETLLDSYVDALIENARLASVQSDGLALAGAVSVEDAQKIIDRLNKTMLPPKSTAVISSVQAAVDAYARLTSKDKPEYLDWGLKGMLNRIYAELGDMIIIGGYPSAGKTALSLQFAAVLSQRYRVGYFSLETLPGKLEDRILSHLGRIPMPKIKQHDFSEADYAGLSKACAELSTLKIDFIPSSGMTVREIQAIAISNKYDIVMVDYLQLVKDESRGNRYEKVTNISQDLHTMAQSTGIAVIALAQLSRAEKVNGKPRPPTIEDLRESGQIEQDADIIFLLYPEEPNDNKSRRILKVGKNKEGEKLLLTLDFDGATQTFTESNNTGESYRNVTRSLAKAKKERAEAERDQMAIEELKDDDGDLPF